MSIWGSFFGIEDEREWIRDLQADGIGAAVIRDGEPESDALDAPYIYEGSHVLPEQNSPRGGGVELAHIAAFIRYYRENPSGDDESYTPLEPFLRLMVHESRSAPSRDPGIATVMLTPEQARRLAAALVDWADAT